MMRRAVARGPGTFDLQTTSGLLPTQLDCVAVFGTLMVRVPALSVRHATAVRPSVRRALLFAIAMSSNNVMYKQLHVMYKQLTVTEVAGGSRAAFNCLRGKRHGVRVGLHAAAKLLPPMGVASNQSVSGALPKVAAQPATDGLMRLKNDGLMQLKNDGLMRLKK